MSFLDWLLLNDAISPFPSPSLLAQTPFSQSMCIHGWECPICRERIEKQQKYEIELQKAILKKQEEYKKRCADYIKKWRENYQAPNAERG